MKHNHKLLAIALSGVLSLSLLAGCGGSGASNAASGAGTTDAGAGDGGPVTLTYYCNPPTNNDIPLMVEAFEAAYPGIKIDMVEMPTDTSKRHQTLSTILQAGDTSMDVFNIDTTWPLTYISAGWLEPVDDALTAEEKALYLEGPLDANIYDGTVYALPAYIDVGILLYRADLLEKYGFQPPSTWDEMAQQAQTIVAGESDISTGFASAWKQDDCLVCCALEFMWAYGGDVLDDAGNVIINSPENAQGLQRMYDLTYVDQVTDTGILSYMWNDARVLFNSGNVVFMRDWPSAYVQATDPEMSEVSGQVGFTKVPGGPGGSNNTLGGWSIAVSQFSQHKEEAKIFAKFMAGADGMKVNAIAASRLPAIGSVYDDADVLAAQPQLEALKDCAEETRGRPKTAYYGELSAVLQQGFSSILADTMSVQAALEQMEPQIEEIMGR